MGIVHLAHTVDEYILCHTGVCSQITLSSLVTFATIYLGARNYAVWNLYSIGKFCLLVVGDHGVYLTVTAVFVSKYIVAFVI